MSHQTGITCSDALKDSLAKAKGQHQRMVRVFIEDEKLELGAAHDAGPSWEKEYDQIVLPVVSDGRACYILYRLDEKVNDSYLWIFIHYVPDKAPAISVLESLSSNEVIIVSVNEWLFQKIQNAVEKVREKMLYASTKSTMKQEFGGGLIKHEVFGNIPDDVSLQGYKDHIVSKAAPGPLSALEADLKYVSELEGGRADIHIDSKHETIKSVGFPLVEEATDALNKFKNRQLNYVQLSLDIKEEVINLANAEPTTVAQLPGRVPSDTARYHLFRFDHTYEGDRFDSAVFIYSMPGYSCPIKERMLYSSCKSTLLDTIENKDQLGIEISKKLELDSGEELTEDFLLDAIHPKKNLHRPAFSKPKGPQGKRGPRRMIRKGEGEQ